MKNLKIIDNNDIENEEIKEVIKSLEEAFNYFGINFYLIGARARDLWLQKHRIKPPTATRDIDFAVLISDVKEFDELGKYLVDNKGFKSFSEAPHRFIFTKNDYIIDLLPFSKTSAYYTHFKDKFDTKISVLGFKEVYEKGTTLEKITGRLIKTATLPGICVLKLIAWSEKPEQRRKDIKDFQVILENYFEIESNQIYESHLDLFDENAEIELIAAQVLGRQIGDIIKDSVDLTEKIVSVFEENIVNPEKSEIADIMVGENSMVVDIIRILERVLTGINEKLNLS